MINIKRIMRHMMMTRWHIKRAFPHATLHAIEQSIQMSETIHSGQIRFVVEGALDCALLFKCQFPRARAVDLFSQLRVWDTELNNGLLIYLLLADRAVEIVADRGINTKVAAQQWRTLCHKMERDFKQENYKGGILSAIETITLFLTQHFPIVNSGANELSDKPVVL